MRRMHIEAGFVLLLAAVAASHPHSRTDYATRLHHDLFENYDKELIPIETDSMDVKVGMSILKLEVNRHNQMTVDGWLRLSWRDYRLQWHPEEYGNISALRLKPDNFWIPDVELYNAINRGPESMSNIIKDGKHNILVYPNGEVLFIPPVREIVQCNETNFDTWPWGEYSCPIKIGSWTYDGNMMNLTDWGSVTNSGFTCVATDDYLKTSEFFITKNSCQENPIKNKYYSCCAEPYTSITYSVKVQRRYLIDEENGLVMNEDMQEPLTSSPDWA